MVRRYGLRWAVLASALSIAACGGDSGDSGDPGDPGEPRPDEEVCKPDGGSPIETPIPFDEGPYGVGIRDRAGDFTVQTLGGSFSLKERWTGEENHLFLVRVAGNSYSDQIAASDFGAFLAASPQNVQYFFLDTADDAAARLLAQEALQQRFEEELAGLGEEIAAGWRERLHFVTDDTRSLDGSLGEFFAVRGAFSFGIDRHQRWRESGLLFDFNDNKSHLRFLGREAAGFDYERRIELEMAALGATEVKVFDGSRHAGGWEEGYSTHVEIELPPAEKMAGFDSMAVHLYTACPAHLQGKDAGCNEWDYAHHLSVCDENDPGKCETELVRYVTPYGREGEWLTDVSALLPLFSDGGKRTLRYSGANGYDMHLRILLWNACKPERPVELRFLYGQSGPIPWDIAYNGLFAPTSFTVEDPATTRMAIYNVVTGHGFGSTWENCAEFCDSAHEFSVNGTPFKESHPEAGDPYGCYDRVEEGVVPNQYGSWPFGRAGWCPGQDVKPWVQDVSAALISGENQLTYRALYRNEPYDPVPNGRGDYMPELRLQSWLVRYEARN